MHRVERFNSDLVDNNNHLKEGKLKLEVEEDGVGAAAADMAAVADQGRQYSAAALKASRTSAISPLTSSASPTAAGEESGSDSPSPAASRLQGSSSGPPAEGGGGGDASSETYASDETAQFERDKRLIYK